MATTEEVYQLIYDIKNQGDLVQLESTLTRLEEKHESLSVSMDRASGRTVNLGRTMLESGRIAQDFAQGGIGGILNNIEGFVQALGMGAGAAGVLTGVGVAATFVLPKIIEFGRSLVEVKTAVPPLANEVDALTEAQRANAKQIDELRSKGRFYGDDLIHLNKLLVEAAQTETKLAEARERAAQVKTMEALKAPEVVGEEQARAKLLTTRLAGQQASIEAGLAQVEAASREKEALEKWTKDKADVARRLKAEEPMEKMFGPTFTGISLRQQQEALKARPVVDQAAVQKQAADLLGGAFAGKAGDWARVEAVMTSAPEMFSKAARQAFAETSPKELAQAEADKRGLLVEENMEKEVKVFRDRKAKEQAEDERAAEAQQRIYDAEQKRMEHEVERDTEVKIRDAERKFRSQQRMSDLVPGSKEYQAAEKIEKSNKLLEDIKQAIIESARKQNPGLVIRGAASR